MTRLGLTQRVSVVEAYGERRDCLDQAWTTLLEPAGYTPILLPNEITDVGGYLEDLALDGVVLTGGNDLAHLDEASNPAPERDRFEAAVLEWALTGDVPVLGVCRGLEFLNHHLGGSLSPVDGHVATEHPVVFDRNTASRDRPLDSPVLAGLDLPDRVAVNSYHDYGIRPEDLAAPLVAVGTAPDGSVEYAVHREKPVCAVMWHPEREGSAGLDRKLLGSLFGGETHG